VTDERLKARIRRLLPKGVRPHRILSGPLRGLRIVTSWYDYPSAILGRTERALLDWFEHNVGAAETWLDVGAHYGYTAIALSRLVGPQGRVFAFEPMLATSGHLARTRALNGLTQLTIIPWGLGDPETIALRRLPAVRGMVDSTIGRDSQLFEPFLIARLDWLWSRICGDQDRVDGVKIDVQGMEIETITGMAALLRSSGPKLVVEVHRGVNRPQLLGLLRSLGYMRTGVPVDPAPNEVESQYLDDRSYSFSRDRGAGVEGGALVE
jgi:FkbM family methyltransferase